MGVVAKYVIHALQGGIVGQIVLFADADMRYQKQHIHILVVLEFGNERFEVFLDGFKMDTLAEGWILTHWNFGIIVGNKPQFYTFQFFYKILWKQRFPIGFVVHIGRNYRGVVLGEYVHHGLFAVHYLPVAGN